MPRAHSLDAEPPPHVSEESVIARSPLFDEDWYLRRYPDVAVSGMNPALHYLVQGAAQGRDPGPQFSTAAYLAANPDVERHGMNPLLHYVLHGKAEGRQIVPSIVIRTNPSVARREYEQKAISDFEAFLDSSDRISTVASDRVRISIVVVLHNKAHFSYACLRSIEKAAHARKDVEAVIVDSGSTDRTGELLSRVDGAVKTVLAENAGFVRSVNRASESCSGDYIVLLNNDAVLKPGSLDYAVQSIQEDDAIAAVGGRITLPSGLLQEAGCILWSDGTAAGYGRGHLPTAPPFMFRRDVAFCSGAFLMIRRKVFIEMGGFDERFAPAYYEETDLCVRFRQAGYRVVYDPRVDVLHYEFGSAESPDAALKLQARQREVFVEKHRDFLAACPAHDSTPILNARSVDGAKKKILFLDDHVPYPELGVGYPRALNILRTLAQSHFVTMIPLEYPRDNWESVRRVVPLEIEVMLDTGASGLAAFLSSRIGYYDLVFVSRPNNLRTYLSALSALEKAQGDEMRAVPIIYDAEAIWALRESLQRAVDNAPMRTDEYEQKIAEEVGLARAASHIIAVNEREAAVFRAGGCGSVSVVSHDFKPSPTSKSFAERQDLLFVGSLDDDPSPNADALLWFAHDILPIVRKELHNPVRLIVAGRSGAQRVRSLAGPNILLLGQVPDLTNVYNSARVFIAPHRYAGGIPTKILEAAAHGLPCVSSDLLAMQLDWRNGIELLSAAEASEFAHSVVRLYTDGALWSAVRTGALKAIEHTYNERGLSQALAESLEVAWRQSRP